MKTSTGWWLRIAWALVLLLCLLAVVARLPPGLAQSPAPPAEKKPPTPTSQDAVEQAALNDAFRSAGNNPQILIKNLEDFLARFPQSARRELVLRTICTYALQANAPAVVAQYGQVLLETKPDDPNLLTLLVDALSQLNDPASLSRGIDYTSRLIKLAENQRDQAPIAGANPHVRAEWPERIATLYARRAVFYQRAGIADKAFSDEQKSFATFPTVAVAEQLGDAVWKKGDSARALDYYLTAFVLPEKGSDPARRKEIRRKLGSVYRTQHHSEKGLGDLVLARYDSLTPVIADRLSNAQTQNP